MLSFAKFLFILKLIAKYHGKQEMNTVALDTFVERAEVRNMSDWAYHMVEWCGPHSSGCLYQPLVAVLF